MVAVGLVGAVAVRVPGADVDLGLVGAACLAVCLVALLDYWAGARGSVAGLLGMSSGLLVTWIAALG